MDDVSSEIEPLFHAKGTAGPVSIGITRNVELMTKDGDQKFVDKCKHSFFPSESVFGIDVEGKI